jgi:plastocyanin
MLALSACAGSSAAEGVAVTAKEMQFLPKTLRVKAGEHTFAITNGGELRHTFSLNALGEEITVEPGKTRTLTLTLEPGTYRYVCRILDHEGLGMRGTLRVSAN